MARGRGMRPTDDLRQDHEGLRAQLALLEGFLSLQADPLPLQKLTSAIRQQVQSHTEREAIVFRALHHALRGEPCPNIGWFEEEHHEYDRELDTLLELLRQEELVPMDEVTTHAAHLLVDLKDHMAREETALFPLIEQRLTTTQCDDVMQCMQEVTARAVSATAPQPPQLSATMTVNHLLMVCPNVRAVLHAFTIDCEADGCHRLHDLARRQGIDVEALLVALSQSLPDPRGGAPVPELLWNSCDGLMVIDADRRILAMNPTVERWIGRRRQEIVGRSGCGVLCACQDLRGEILWDHADRCPGLRAMRRFQPVTAAQYTIRAAGGRRIAVSASYTPIQPNPSGAVWALVVMRDNRVQARRERRLCRQAMTDPLTGLPNRARLLELFERELAQAARHAQPLSVAVAALDGFEAYRQTYGHLAGDERLKALAEVLHTALRTEEFVARYGGDGLAFLLPETDARGAMLVAARLCRLVAEFPFVRAQGNGHSAPSNEAHAPAPAQAAGPVTLSMGVAVFPADGRSVETLLAQADRRLFEAKQQGLHHVIGPPSTEEPRSRRRVELEASILVRSRSEEPDGVWHEGRVINVSLGGVYFTVTPWKRLTREEVLTLSITVPQAWQRAFPFSRLAGLGRVVRVEEHARASEPDETQLGLALAFGEDLTTLAVPSGSGRSRSGSSMVA